MLESPHEKDKLETYQGLLVSQRRIFLESICNETDNTTRLEELLVEYELVVEEASYNGINIVTQDYSINWDYIQEQIMEISIQRITVNTWSSDLHGKLLNKNGKFHLISFRQSSSLPPSWQPSVTMISCRKDWPSFIQYRVWTLCSSNNIWKIILYFLRHYWDSFDTVRDSWYWSDYRHPHDNNLGEIQRIHRETEIKQEEE